MPGILVVADTDGSAVLPATSGAICFAQELSKRTGEPFNVCVMGGSAIDAAPTASSGAETVYLAAGPEMEHPTADRAAAVVAHLFTEHGFRFVVGAATSFGRDILPRVAGLLDLPMITDVIAIEEGAGPLRFRRPVYAGNLIATVEVGSESGVFSVRATSFDSPATAANPSPTIPVDLAAVSLPSGTRWVGVESGSTSRPDLTSARVVVSGGRPLRDAATFERVIGGLADRLGGAVGATRAAVDSGIAPNELQVGQTGKVVAPDLYIAAGISGSVQHLAGMKDSKVIVAINTDAQAPIFDVADYGLVADLHQAVPELTSKL